MSSPTARSLSAETKVRLSPRVYAREFGEEMVLLDFGLGEYFGLDSIGAEVWRQLEAGEALNVIADRIVERYEVTRDVALKDILELVEEMRERALVETF
ncbi:MAG TPA: PqqD family protein [Labilithrix sp.]|nr:PqqD family protein [Labilithrix sp.]